METSRFRVLSLPEEVQEKIYSGEIDELWTTHKDMILLPGSSLQDAPTNVKFIPILKLFSDGPSAAQSPERHDLVDITMESRISAPRGPLTARELRLLRRNMRKVQMAAATMQRSNRTNNNRNMNINNNSNNRKAKDKSNNTRNRKRNKATTKSNNNNSSTNNKDKKESHAPSATLPVSVSGQGTRRRKKRLPTAKELLQTSRSQSIAHTTREPSWKKKTTNACRSVAARSHSRSKARNAKRKNIFKPSTNATTYAKDKHENNNSNTNNKKNDTTSDNDNSNQKESINKNNNKNNNVNAMEEHKDDAKIDGEGAMEGSNVNKFGAFSQDWGNDETLTFVFIFESDKHLVTGMALTGDVTKVDETYDYKLLHYMRVDSGHAIQCNPAIKTNVLFIEGWKEVYLLNGFGYKWMRSLRRQYTDQLSLCA